MSAISACCCFVVEASGITSRGDADAANTRSASVIAVECTSPVSGQNDRCIARNVGGSAADVLGLDRDCPQALAHDPGQDPGKCARGKGEFGRTTYDSEHPVVRECPTSACAIIPLKGAHPHIVGGVGRSGRRKGECLVSCDNATCSNNIIVITRLNITKVDTTPSEIYLRALPCGVGVRTTSGHR